MSETNEKIELTDESLEQVSGGGEWPDGPNCKYYKSRRAYKTCPAGGFMGRTHNCSECFLNKYN